MNVFPKFEEILLAGFLNNLILLGDTENISRLASYVFTLPSVSDLFCEVPACPFAASQAFVQELSSKFSMMQVLCFYF